MSEGRLWSPISSTFKDTRADLHQLAFYALSPVRYAGEGRMGLEPTPGGFGTPSFSGRVARVDGTMLVHEQAGNIATTSITTLRDAVRFLGRDYQEVWFDEFHDPLPPTSPDRGLRIAEVDVAILAAWFDFAFDVLAEFGAGANESSSPQIWPEHFDAAIEAGEEALGRRASYGLSPGDAGHAEPYAYVAPWGGIDPADGFWNDTSFPGASLGYPALAASTDARADLLRFFGSGYERLTAG